MMVGAQEIKYCLDATKITKYDCSNEELELRILFWICAAGKNGVTSAKCICRLLNYYAANGSPFEIIRRINKLPNVLKKFGIGCYNQKAQTMLQLVNSGLNLRTCTVDDLERIKGCGSKTVRCFMIHSRPNQRLAGLDRHILSYMRDCGIPTPKSTPTKKKYRELELKFLELADKSGKSVSQLDLDIWNRYSGNKK